MKAIIIAGGKGTRLMPYTRDIPKCLLKFNGISLLERQVNLFHSCKIKDIVLLKGHLEEKISVTGITRSYKDPVWVENMASALLAAEKELNDSIIVSYGDIVFEKSLLERMINCEKDICVGVDDNWLGYWKARFDGDLKDTESLQLGKDGSIKELGAPDTEIEKCQARYIGLLKFSKKGTDILKKVYHKNKKKYWNKNEKWLNSKSFKQAYMTDVLQAIINSGFKIWPVHMQGGWLEFDTAQDYKKAKEWVKNGTIKRFFSLER